MTIEKLYTTREVANLTGYSHLTIRRYASDGKIEGQKFNGKDWRFTAKNINDFINKQRGTSNE